MRAMAPWMSAMLVVSPLSRLIFLSRWSWIKLIYDSVSLVVVTLPLWYHLEGAYQALQTVSWLKTLQLVLYFGLLVFVLAELAKTKGEE